MRHDGNLFITAGNAEKCRDLTSVGGDLYIGAEANLDALTSVGGYLYIHGNANLDALTSVGGHLSIGAEANLDALTSVGGYLSIGAEANLDALTSVGGDVSIYGKANLDALTSVGGYLYIHGNANLGAPNLYPPGFANFAILDGIPSVTLSRKQRGDIRILRCKRARIHNQKLVGEPFYVAQQDGVNAHGKTIAEAICELEFKTSDRDVTPYQNLALDTTKTRDEWVAAYRIVTGACQLGTKMFLDQQAALKRRYTLAEVIDLTLGQYGHEQFVATVMVAEE